MTPQYNEHRKFVERWLAKLGEKKEAETEAAPEPAQAPEGKVPPLTTRSTANSCQTSQQVHSQ